MNIEENSNFRFLWALVGVGLRVLFITEMNTEEFFQSVSQEKPPDVSDCLQALWWAKKGDWDRAHDIAQEIKTPEGSWVHAYLHRIEGDTGNAEYWYRLAGKSPKSNDSLLEEWNDLVGYFFCVS